MSSKVSSEVVEMEMKVLNSENRNICRICMNGNLMEGKEGTTLSPRLRILTQMGRFCACKGDLGLQHMGCMLQWMLTSGHKQCEICGKEIFLQCYKHGIALPFATIRKVMSTWHYMLIHLILILAGMVIFFSLVFTTDNMLDNIFDKSNDTKISLVVIFMLNVLIISIFICGVLSYYSSEINKIARRSYEIHLKNPYFV